MRGNGLVVVADSLAQVVSLIWYLEDAARTELAVRSANPLAMAPHVQLV